MFAKHFRYRPKTKNFFLKVCIVGVIAIGLCMGASASAQTKSFIYDRIDFTYDVKEDSTVDVSEVITYSFTGSYHTATRDLILNKLDSIDNIAVFEFDPVTLEETPLVYKRFSQDKLDPKSWGTYNVKTDGSHKVIQWYFDATDTQKIYRINYTLHGAISFLKDKQELYWNLFTDFEAPIRSIQALVFLPKQVPVEELEGTIYSSGTHTIGITSTVYDTSGEPAGLDYYLGFNFGLTDIAAHEAVTIGAGWQKGVVSQKAYFIDAAMHYFPIIVSILAALFTIIYLSIFWYRREVRGARGVVVAQYEPPRGLTPAVMSLVLYEDLPIRAMTATIIDLAVRGYIEISEDVKGFLASSNMPAWVRNMIRKDYNLTLVRPVDDTLSAFEKRYIKALRLETKPFSTRDYRIKRSTYLVEELPIVANAAYKDTKGIEDVFTVSLKKEKMNEGKFWVYRLGPLFFVGYAYLFVASKGLMPQYLLGRNLTYIIMCVVLYVCYVLYERYTKYEAYLSPTGNRLYDEIKGFELFLSITGKDRMQKLTPDMFEKYLPYAVLFEIEKDWAKNFDGMHLQSPGWYHGYLYGAHAGFSTGVAGASSFSASSFSSSLSSSFSSAMSSSGAGGGGGSGGGGGAGGGGGGGGGGAS